jgi:ATP-dependent helicase/nuclease subunit B
VYVKKDQTMGRKNYSDACESNEFISMLGKVRQKLAELADGIMNGQIAIAPYRIGQASPCAMCGYQSICRFDAKFNEYHILQSMKREDVLARVVEECKS